MKKFFSLCMIVLMCTSAFARTETLKPTIEWRYRTNDSNKPSNWNNGYPIEITSSGAVEIRSSARIFILQQFDLSGIDFDNVLSMSLSYTRGGSESGAEIAAWGFNISTWGKDNNFWSTLGNSINTALGVNIGSSNPATVTPIFYANRGTTSSYNQNFSVSEINSIKTALIEGKLNLLVTSTERSGEEGNYTYSLNAARTDIYNYLDEERCAKLVISIADVENNTQSKKYNGLASAVSEAAAGDEVTVFGSQTLDSRIDCDAKALTIKGKTGNEVLTLGNSNNMLLLATNNVSTDLTIENLILDGNNYSTAKNFIEASGKMTIKNSTIRNYTTSNGQGVIVSKAGGNLTLENVAFDNCKATASGVVFRGTGVTVKKNISFTNCSDKEVYIERKDDYLRAEEIGWTKPLKVFCQGGANETLAISAPGASGGKLEDKFEILNEGLRLTHSGHYTDMTLITAPTFSLSAEVPYATFCVDYDSFVPSGVKAYIAKKDGSTILLSNYSETIPAGSGVVLYAPNISGNINFTLQTASQPAYDTIDDNIFEGTTDGTTSADCYVMSKSQSTNGPLTFGHYNGLLPANKAYIPANKVSSVSALRFKFDSDLDEIVNEGYSTKISAVETQATDGACYDLFGRRVMNKVNGLFIQNGKKVIVKK